MGEIPFIEDDMGLAEALKEWKASIKDKALIIDFSEVVPGQAGQLRYVPKSEAANLPPFSEVVDLIIGEDDG